MKQLDLFPISGPSAKELPEIEADRALAARRPAQVRLGTSTWTFPGWRGIFYPHNLTERDINAHGLRYYTTNPLFRTVGIDRSFYAPLSDSELVQYQNDLPEGFPCVMKVFRDIVARADPKTAKPSPAFLDPNRFVDLIEKPVARSFAKNLGVLLLVLSPIPASHKLDPKALEDALAHFFENVPRSFRYAVELRNPELFTSSYLKTLQHYGVAHVLSSWERMPSVGRQMLLKNVLTAPFCVCRLSIRSGERYEERFRAFSPFNRIVEVDAEMRADVLALASQCLREKRELFILVNNKMEGSAPLTVRALAKLIADKSQSQDTP